MAVNTQPLFLTSVLWLCEPVLKKTKHTWQPCYIENSWVQARVDVVHRTHPPHRRAAILLGCGGSWGRKPSSSASSHPLLSSSKTHCSWAAAKNTSIDPPDHTFPPHPSASSSCSPIVLPFHSLSVSAPATRGTCVCVFITVDSL